MNITEILKDIESLGKNFNTIIGDIDSIKKADTALAETIENIAGQIAEVKEYIDGCMETVQSMDDWAVEKIFNLTKSVESLVTIESFEAEIAKIKEVEEHLYGLIAQSDKIAQLEEAFKASQAEAAANKAETDKKIDNVKGDIENLKTKDADTDKKIAENTSEIRNLKYQDEETGHKIKDLDNKIEKAKLGNAQVDSEQAEHITKNTETIASLDEKITSVNKRVDGAITRISMLDSEIEKYHKVKKLPMILLAAGVEVVRFGAYFGLAALILKRIIFNM